MSSQRQYGKITTHTVKIVHGQVDSKPEKSAKEVDTVTKEVVDMEDEEIGEEDIVIG